MSEWISVEERLPQNFHDVLIYDEIGIGGGCVRPGNSLDPTGFYDWNTNKHNPTVKYWRELPEPPEEQS